MIAAERQQKRARLDDLRRLRLDQPRRLPVMTVVEHDVTIVDDRHGFEEIARERILRVVVEDRRSPADGLWPEPRARPIGDRRIEGNAEDDRIGADQILGIAPPHEGQRARIGRVGGSIAQGLGGKGVVDGF